MMSILETLRGEVLLLKTAYQREGFWYVLREGIIYTACWPINILSTFYYRHLQGRRPTFVFQGQAYQYFYHSYNTTWKNDRSVEIPIFLRIVEESRGKKILEVGNVLRHYFPCNHDVVDLNEKYPGVINKDIVQFQPSTKYDLVISISTLEHVGWDQRPREPGKILLALKNLIEKVVTPGGKIILSVPLGYNDELDRLLATDKLHFTSVGCLRQISQHSYEREEISWDEIRRVEFDDEGRWIGTDKVVIIGVIT